MLIAGYAEPSAVIAFGTGVRFGGGTEAADLLAGDPTGIAIVSDEQKAAFEARLSETGAKAEAIGRVEGFNYAKGKRITLTLYKRAAA